MNAQDFAMTFALLVIVPLFVAILMATVGVTLTLVREWAERRKQRLRLKALDDLEKRRQRGVNDKVA